jgi:hypothetical protein
MLAGCASPAATPATAVAVKPAQEFTLAPGQSVRIDGTELVLEFSSVSEDSRCARNVTCIWEGNARVVLTLTEPAKAGVRLELNTSSRFATSARTPFGTIELRGLAPQPPIDAPSNYRATLYFEAAR